MLLLLLHTHMAHSSVQAMHEFSARSIHPTRFIPATIVLQRRLRRRARAAARQRADRGDRTAPSRAARKTWWQIASESQSRVCVHAVRPRGSSVTAQQQSQPAVNPLSRPYAFFLLSCFFLFLFFFFLLFCFSFLSVSFACPLLLPHTHWSHHQAPDNQACACISLLHASPRVRSTTAMPPAVDSKVEPPPVQLRPSPSWGKAERRHGNVAATRRLAMAHLRDANENVRMGFC